LQVDRNTNTIGTCDINLSFGAHPAEIQGIVRFLHPLHNFALSSLHPFESDNATLTYHH
jgi:hypothetical protein